MKNFFWTTFGIFFILATLVGFIVIILNFIDWIWTRRKFKELNQKKYEDYKKGESNSKPKND